MATKQRVLRGETWMWDAALGWWTASQARHKILDTQETVLTGVRWTLHDWKKVSSTHVNEVFRLKMIHDINPKGGKTIKKRFLAGKSYGALNIIFSSALAMTRLRIETVPGG